MNTRRNPGMLAVLVGVGLGVLFALLGIAGVLDTRVGLGLAVTSFLVAALLYIFYMRGTAVSRTGYASVIAILAIGLIIPLLTVTQQQDQANQTSTQYDLTLHRGAALFGQYCAPCHGYQGQGLIGPQLNGEGAGVPAPVKLTDEEITRTISGGVPDPAQINTYLMPAWLNTYGGPLTQDDISYLLALIRSSEPSYLKQHPELPNTNGFNYVFASLSAQQKQTAVAEGGGGGPGTPTPPTKPADNTFQDMTGKKAVTITAENDASGGGTFHWAAGGGNTANIIVSAGTKVTWTNNSSVAHNVYSGYGTFLKIPAPDGFKSSIFTAGNGSFSYTYDTPGEYPFFCGIHPYMKGWVTVK